MHFAGEGVVLNLKFSLEPKAMEIWTDNYITQNQVTSQAAAMTGVTAILSYLTDLKHKFKQGNDTRA